MTNNQEKLLRGKLTKWLEARGNTPGDVEQKTNAWLQYFDGIKKPVVMLAACTWLCSGAVILPEDMPKVEQAVKVAEINKVDPLRFDRPMSIMEAFPSTELREAPIDPDTVPTLHLARRFDSGLAIYDVDESQESRENMRRIINTHFGKDSSPWCLLQGDGEGNLTENSLEYWNHYNAYPKQVAFVDGKLTAFSANDRNEKVWWDRTDKARKEVSVAGAPRAIKGDPLGRSATYVYDTETGIPWYENIIRRQDDVLVERYANIESKDYTLDILVDEKKREEIKSIVVPDGMTEIRWKTFENCSSLREIHIPDGVTKIKSGTFAGCSSLREIRIPDGVTKIEWAAFDGCSSLREVYIPDGVTEIGDGTFCCCSSLQEIHIPDGVTEIGANVFYGCSSLREIYIPDSITKIKAETFVGCSSLQEIRIPDSVMEIGRHAFEGCSSLQEIHIPDGVTRIEGYTFWNCSSLRKIYIPDSVIEIGECAFWKCSSLKEIHVSPTASQSLFDRLHKVAPNDCAIVRDLPEKDLSALRERGVSEAAIRELQEKGSVHIHEKTFYRPSTEVSPCPDSARTVFTNVVAVIENGTVRMKDPRSRADLGDAKSFFSGRKHVSVSVGIQNGQSVNNDIKHKIS